MMKHSPLTARSDIRMTHVNMSDGTHQSYVRDIFAPMHCAPDLCWQQNRGKLPGARGESYVQVGRVVCFAHRGIEVLLLGVGVHGDAVWSALSAFQQPHGKASAAPQGQWMATVALPGLGELDDITRELLYAAALGFGAALLKSFVP